MSDIMNDLNTIREARYGKDVRKSIADGIETCYKEGKAGTTDLQARQDLLTKASKTELDVERKRIDNLAKLPSGSTTGDAELIDIRVGADGKTYPNAGDAVREQVSSLKEDLRKLAYNDFELIPSKYIEYNSGIAYGYLVGDLLRATDFIKISKLSSHICFYGLKYNEDNSAGIAFYDSSKKYITGYKLFGLPNKIELPDNSEYVRVTVPIGCIDYFAISYLQDNNKTNSFIENANTKLSTVTDSDCDFIKVGKNLFDKRTVTKGYYVDPGTGVLLENSKFWASDFIEVEPNTTYTLRYTNQCSQYDEDRKCLGDFMLVYSDTTNAKPATATTKPNAKYVRICGSLSQLDTDQFEKGDSFTFYEEFSKKIDSSLIPKTKTLEDIIYKIFSGTNTKIKLVGDSITHGMGGTGFNQNGEYIGSFFGNKYYRNPNGYCWAKLFKDYLESKFSCSVTNNAVSGTSFKELNDAFTSLVSDSDDIVICMYGTNNRDSLSSMPAWIQSVINKFNDLSVDLIIMTPISASVTDETKRTNHIEDMCNTIKKLCIKNNVVFVDTNQIMLDYCEYRDISIDTLLADGLHPNDNGHLILFNAVCKSLGISRKVTGATW